MKIRTAFGGTAALVPLAMMAAPAAAQAQAQAQMQPQALGADTAACQPGGGPAIQATVTGLKDRSGEVRLELYPATPDDFLRGDKELVAAGKTFRRIAVAPPRAGPAVICIRVPRPGRYALLMTHNRDGHMKFDYKVDGAGTPGNKRIGLGKPKVDAATVTVGPGVTPVAIRAQYLGLFGFSPSSAP